MTKTKILSRTIKKAHKLIKNKHHFTLNTEQWNKFCNSLNPHPEENKALKKLLNSKEGFR
jgi:uncharacterized protein (DUF1778 family)